MLGSHRHGGRHCPDPAHPLRPENRCAAQLPRADGGLRARLDGGAFRLGMDGAPACSATSGRSRPSASPTRRRTTSSTRSSRRSTIPASKPNPCEYCGWCAKADTCPARLAHCRRKPWRWPIPASTSTRVLADPEKLGRFLAACAVVEDFRERAKKIATERIKTGGEVPGWKLVTRKGAEFVDCETVGHHIQRLGFGPVLAAYGNLSATKFRDLWSQRMPARHSPRRRSSTPLPPPISSKPNQTRNHESNHSQADHQASGGPGLLSADLGGMDDGQKRVPSASGRAERRRGRVGPPCLPAESPYQAPPTTPNQTNH